MRWSMIVIAVFVLVACAPQAEENVLPVDEVTEEVVETPQPTPTPLQRPTLPPTWTPSPVPGSSEAQTAGETPSAGDTQQQAEPPVVIAPPTPLEVCAVFGEDRTLNNRRFTPGAPVQVFWVGVEGAVSYSISLVNEAGEVILTSYSIEPTFLFQPDVFEPDRMYGWEVYPIDNAGRQMCFSRGAELIPDTMPQ